MYEDMTYDALLAAAKADVGDGVQKGEGSLVFNALSALAFELERLYMAADYILNEGFADTADMDGLIRIAANRGITRKAATHASVSVTCDAAVPIGWRASLKGYNYVVTEVLDAERIQVGSGEVDMAFFTVLVPHARIFHGLLDTGAQEVRRRIHAVSLFHR